MRPIGDLILALDHQRDVARVDRANLIDDLVEIIAEETLISMDAEQEPDGTPWEPLSPAYAKWKDAHHPGKIKGELFGRMKARENITQGDRIIAKDRVFIVYGLDDEVKAYAYAFNFGRPDNNQPARKFVGFSARCKQRLVARIGRHIAETIKGS